MEPPIHLERTDANLAAVLSKPTIGRPARKAEFADIRADAGTGHIEASAG